ncbi:MAG: non-homologous end-joining DNA ligase [Labilithrix sp.]|nr:non-homologous end-joining DNA ligase [Labilithrix sp.]
MSAKRELLHLAGREVAITNPDKVFFPDAGYTKRDIVDYYLTVADGALRGVRGRPMALKRFPDGITEEPFFQKRAPKSRPEWIETVTLSFPSGRTADEIVVRDVAQLAWVINLGCIDLNPHPTRADDLDHPDELRIDLDPVPGVGWKQIVEVAKVTREVLVDMGLEGWPKTSGSRGVHVYARVQRAWGFDDVRRAALAVAREVERRAPSIATSKWWKEERHGVFLDYNQNAKDRTVASAYSIRPTRDARVSFPLSWDELATCEPGDFTLKTVAARFVKTGDAHAKIDDDPGSLEPLLALAARQEAEGMADAPWPPHYAKQAGEAPRVAPSRAKAAPKPSRLRAHASLLIVAKAERKHEALEGLERWKKRHPEAAPYLAEDDVLVDAMRGRSSAWYRVRVNLRHVPEEKRPAAETPDPNYEPTFGPQ